MKFWCHRWLLFHKWSNWSEATPHVEHGYYVYQTRKCLICGLTIERSL